MRTRLSSALSLSLMLALAPVAAADTLFVDADLATGADDGSSWPDAFQGALGLQDALAAAVAGDQIFVAQGTYLATDTGVRTISFALKIGVEVYGSFLGGETSPAERPPFGTAPSVLSGDLAGNDGLAIFSDNTIHLVTTTGTDATAVLDGFVVSSGAAAAAGANNDRGAGILCLGAVSPTIRNCRFVGNRCTFGGAAGYVNNGGAPSFTDCSFEDGDGNNFGGAFDIAGGGAVLFERCFFRGNTADRGGALEIFSTTGAVVNNCVFQDNVATGTGGGGGLWIGSGGNARVRNCTIMDNESTTNAVAGLRIQNAANASVANCILWGNTGPAGAQGADNQVNAAANVTFSIVQGGFLGTGNLDQDPNLSDLGGGVLKPTPSSPGTDAGSNAEAQPGTTLDFAQQPRFEDDLAQPDVGVGPAPIVDIGALELQTPWTDLGHALAGTSGAPTLIFDSTLFPLSIGELSLTGALPGSLAFLVIGLSQIDAPFKGGVMVPDADSLTVVGPLAIGEFHVVVQWPFFIPAGVELYFQFWVPDPGGPKGFAASNALKGVTQ
jgi:Right handed beta helix region